MVLEGPILALPTVASMTLLKASLVMTRETSSCDVPMLSSVSDWILETCTPISRWMPEHSMQIITPKFVESHVASAKRARRHHSAAKKRTGGRSDKKGGLAE